jgi:nicotinamidase-related amidase
MGKTCLLVIDPQYDFCYEGTGIFKEKRGALYVDGAHDDICRLSLMIHKMGTKINQIHVSLDAHFLITASHPGMWKNKEGTHPAPYTVITRQDIMDKKWMPIYPEYEQWFLYYTSELEKDNRYELRIWPPHCLIGDIGQTVDPFLTESLRRWQESAVQNIHFVCKGSSIYTEHHSAFKAAVVYPGDKSTQLNKKWIMDIEENDTILLAGEALLHCLKTSLEDLIEGFESKRSAQKIILLEDATSAVPLPEHEALSKEFIDKMKSMGVKTAKTTDF